MMVTRPVGKGFRMTTSNRHHLPLKRAESYSIFPPIWTRPIPAAIKSHRKAITSAGPRIHLVMTGWPVQDRTGRGETFFGKLQHFGTVLAGRCLARPLIGRGPVAVEPEGDASSRGTRIESVPHELPAPTAVSFGGDLGPQQL